MPRLRCGRARGRAAGRGGGRHRARPPAGKFPLKRAALGRGSATGRGGSRARPSLRASIRLSVGPSVRGVRGPGGEGRSGGAELSAWPVSGETGRGGRTGQGVGLGGRGAAPFLPVPRGKPETPPPFLLLVLLQPRCRKSGCWFRGNAKFCVFALGGRVCGASATISPSATISWLG